MLKVIGLSSVFFLDAIVPSFFHATSIQNVAHFGPKFCQGKTPWVEQSCADCPGFPVLGAGDAPPPELHPGASNCAPGLAFAFMALRRNSWILLPARSLPPAQKRDAQHMFLQHRRAHTDSGASAKISLPRTCFKCDQFALPRSLSSASSKPTTELHSPVSAGRNDTDQTLGIPLKPQPPHTRQKYEQRYGPQTSAVNQRGRERKGPQKSSRNFVSETGLFRPFRVQISL